MRALERGLAGSFRTCSRISGAIGARVGGPPYWTKVRLHCRASRAMLRRVFRRHSYCRDGARDRTEGGHCDEKSRRAAAYRPGQAGDRGDPPPARPRARSAVSGAACQLRCRQIRRLGGSGRSSCGPAQGKRPAAGIGCRSRHAGGRGHRRFLVISGSDQSIGAELDSSVVAGTQCGLSPRSRSGTGAGRGDKCPRVGGNRGAGDGEVAAARRREGRTCCDASGGMPASSPAALLRRALASRCRPSGARRDRGPAPSSNRIPCPSLPGWGGRGCDAGSIGAARVDPVSIANRRPRLQ